MKSGILSMVSVCAGVVGITSAASAGYTAVNGAPGGELGHAAILHNVYGGTFSVNESPVPGYSNGTMTLTRLSDTGLGGILSIISADSSLTDDQAWSGSGAGSVTVTAEAKYAGDSHKFGWLDGSGDFHQLLRTHELGSSASLVLPGNFRWALKDTTTEKTWTSRNSDNVKDGKPYDQMVTYRVNGAGITQPTFLLFWEDRIAGGADYDYNDAVVQVTACAVPAPGAASFGAIGLTVLARRRRR